MRTFVVWLAGTLAGALIGIGGLSLASDHEGPPAQPVLRGEIGDAVSAQCSYPTGMHGCYWWNDHHNHKGFYAIKAGPWKCKVYIGRVYNRENGTCKHL